MSSEGFEEEDIDGGDVSSSATGATESLDKEKKEVPPVPRIFEMMVNTDSVEDMVVQVQKEFYSGDTLGRERALIGVVDLLSRGEDGLEVLETLSRSSDEFGTIAKAVLENPGMSFFDMEELFGIKRFGRVVEVDHTNYKEHLNKLHLYAVVKGYTDIKDPDVFYDELVHQMQMNRLINPHLNGGVEDEVVAISSVFGIDEPVYIDLAGPMEILRLRMMKEPRFLLAGSLGATSTVQIKSYADKINPTTEVHVLDILPKSIDHINNDERVQDQHVVRGDLRKMPYADSSMDHIYTSNLLPAMPVGGSNNLANIHRFFQECARVLKPDGSLFMSDSIRDSVMDIPAVIETARAYGLEATTELSTVRKLAMAPEIGMPKIDENGFGHYEDCLLMSGRSGEFGDFYIRFIKL